MVKKPLTNHRTAVKRPRLATDDASAGPRCADPATKRPQLDRSTTFDPISILGTPATSSVPRREMYADISIRHDSMIRTASWTGNCGPVAGRAVEKIYRDLDAETVMRQNIKPICMAFYFRNMALTPDDIAVIIGDDDPPWI